MVRTSEAKSLLVWLLCSSAKARKNSLSNQKSCIKKFKWSRTEHILLHSVCSYLQTEALAVFWGSADLTQRIASISVSIFSIQNCWSRRGYMGERGHPWGRRPHGGNAVLRVVSPEPHAHCRGYMCLKDKYWPLTESEQIHLGVSESLWNSQKWR